MKHLTQYHWYHRRNSTSNSNPISSVLPKWARNSFCEWNYETRTSGPVARSIPGSTPRNFRTAQPGNFGWMDRAQSDILGLENFLFFPRPIIIQNECNLHWCYTFCTGVTLELSQSESRILSEFFFFFHTYIFIRILLLLLIRCRHIASIVYPSLGWARLIEVVFELLQLWRTERR